jgi:hypothetical protein
MTRRTWLNDLIERFQHRWETSSQYRAAMSGVLGLVFLIVICSCVGALTATTGSVLGALGLSGSNNGQAQAHSQGKDVKGYATFPIATVNLPSPSTIPDSTLTTSGTPLPTATTAPTPTDTPTATPCTSNCGGGGGGGGCKNCNVTASFSGAWQPGGSVSITLYATQGGSPQSGVGINIIGAINGCVAVLNGGSGVTLGNGYYTFSFQICGGASRPQTAPFTVEANFNGDVHTYGFTHAIT